MERLFNPKVAESMEKRGYMFEAHYVRTIHNWWRATDERGLTQQERSQYTKECLNLVLDELMPWHQHNPDYRRILSTTVTCLLSVDSLERLL